MRWRSRGAATSVFVLATLAGIGAPVAGRATSPGHYLENDLGTEAGVRNLMPAGERGDITRAQYAQEQVQPGYVPPHLDDQRPLYDGLALLPDGAAGTTDVQKYMKSETFGVPDDQIESIETPRADVTIIRDKAFGVPHIYGTSKHAAEFGSGYASAEDRLFLMDVVRHDGRGNLASLTGSSAYSSDCSIHYGTGYDSADELAQVHQLTPEFQVFAQDFADGVNAFINDPAKQSEMPVEYTVFAPPAPWTPSDTLAVGSLIGGQLGNGGGSEARNTLAFEGLTTRYGTPAAARQVMDDFHAANDPESPTTIDVPFPYETRNGIDPRSVALIDKAPSDPNGCTHTSVGGTTNAPALPGSRTQEIRLGAQQEVAAIQRELQFPHHLSNALLVSGDRSRDGHPFAVFGSQAAYFVPEIYMEMDVHAPDYDARGYQFPGTGVFVEIGRGQDFAWSATSAGSDNQDQRVERLCNPTSSDPLQNVDPNSTSYFYKGKCLPMIEKTLTYTVPPSPGTLPGLNPSLAGQPFVGTETFQVERVTHDDGVAIVQGRTTAKVNGVSVPVAVSLQRTNFLHELDQATGFNAWNTPSVVHDAASFMHAASQVSDTFNWLYVDNKDIAFYSSGLLPNRRPGADPDLLNWGTGEWDWQGFLSENAHPHAINPAKGWMTSWNNRPAPQFGSSDAGYDYGPAYRSQLLDREIQKRLAAGGGKTTLPDLFSAMHSASIKDFRAQELMDEISAVIGPLSALSASQQSALAAVLSWHSAGD
ncbi:MAG: penicillin acylase family protein, partial [Candidatus Dormibacteria bacterium]